MATRVKRNDADGKRFERHRRPRGEGSIQQLADGSFRGYLTLGGRRVYRRGDTRAEVSRKLLQARREFESGKPAPTTETVDEYLRRWLYEQVKPAVGHRTWEAYRSRLKNLIVPSLGKIRLVDLTHRDISRTYDCLREAGIAPSTLRDLHRIVRSAFTFSVKEGSLARSPADLVPYPHRVEIERRRLSIEEIRVLLEHSDACPFGTAFVVSLAGALRWSEVAGLRWQDVA